MRAGSGVALPASVKIMKKEGGCGSLLLCQAVHCAATCQLANLSCPKQTSFPSSLQGHLPLLTEHALLTALR